MMGGERSGINNSDRGVVKKNYCSNKPRNQLQSPITLQEDETTHHERGVIRTSVNDESGTGEWLWLLEPALPGPFLGECDPFVNFDWSCRPFGFFFLSAVRSSSVSS